MAQCLIMFGIISSGQPNTSKKVLTGEIAEYCRKLLKEIADEYEFQIAWMEIMPDHVYLFVTAHPKKAPGKQPKNIPSMVFLLK